MNKFNEHIHLHLVCQVQWILFVDVSAEMFLLPLSQLVKQFLIQVTGMVFLYPTQQLTRFVLGLIPKPSLEFFFKMGSGYETSLYLCTELLLNSSIKLCIHLHHGSVV